jgi:Arc/MetJ family transcription regulator
MAASRTYSTSPKKRTTINLDLSLVREAKRILGTANTTDTIHRALQEAIRRELLLRLAKRDFADLTLEALEEMRRPRHTEDS